MANSGDLNKRMQLAEWRAMQREEVDLGAVAREEQKANARQAMIVLKRPNKLVRHTQRISENYMYLVGVNYLTGAEEAFLSRLEPYVQMNTNAIVDIKTGQFLTVSQIAEKVRKTRTATSMLIGSLLEKYLLFEFVNAVDYRQFGRNVSQRPLYMNPEIICAGSQHRLDAGIVDLIMHSSLLEKKGVKLPIKVYRAPHAKYGKLISRKQYLAYKRSIK